MGSDLTPDGMSRDYDSKSHIQGILAGFGGVCGALKIVCEIL